MKSKTLCGLWLALALLPAASGAREAPADRRLLWGDTHLHTSYAFDAFLKGNRTADPETAYRYARGVPMGGTLGRDREARAPALIVRAERDPMSATLDRLQVVKGWLDTDGTSREQVLDVAWAGDRRPDADGRVPPVADTVDRGTCARDDSVGVSELSARWTDPSFDPEQSAFYYARVLEIPTPRHAQLDAIALGLDAPAEGPQTIQERAYGSPIWYQPGD